MGHKAISLAVSSLLLSVAVSIWVTQGQTTWVASNHWLAPVLFGIAVVWPLCVWRIWKRLRRVPPEWAIAFCFVAATTITAPFNPRYIDAVEPLAGLPVSARTITTNATIRMSALRDSALADISKVLQSRASTLAPSPVEVSLPEEKSKKPPIHPYPYISTGSDYRDASGIIKTIGLNLRVNEYPTPEQARKGIASRASLTLYNLHAIISVPILARLESKWWAACKLADIREPEWNNDSSPRDLSTVELSRNITVLQINASARNGAWTGVVILRRLGDDIEREEGISGEFVAESGERERMAVREVRTRGRLEITDAGALTDITANDLIVKYGVSTANMTKDQLDSACPKGAIVHQEFGRGTKQLIIPYAPPPR